MANGTTSQIQLPPGYEDAAPVAGPLATQNTSGISLPPGYEDAKPVAGPHAQQTPPAAAPLSFGGVARELGGQAWDAAKGVVKSLVPGSPEQAAAVEGTAKGIWNASIPGQLVDSVKQTLPLIDTYEKSRASGASISDALKSVNDTAKQQLGKHDVLGHAVEAYRTNPNHETAKLLLDGTLAATALYGLGGAAPEAEAATAGDATAAPVASAPTNPFRITKIEPAVDASTAKAGLTQGVAGVTDAEAAAKTAQSAHDAQAATQTSTDQALESIAARHASETGIPAPTAGTASRDLITNNGNALVNAGKADYQVLDKYTDGKFTNAQNELKNAQLELQQKAGTTDADTTALEANITRAQWNVDKLFDDAVKNGMPKDTADAARVKFRTGQATLDAGNAVRMANRIRGAAGVRTTDLNALENRWTALYDSGRLQQAFGEQGAKDALTQIHAARETGEIFNSLPPTESQALRELIAKNTTTGKFGTSTDWGKVRDAFSQMPDRAARFSDIPKVEKFINDQKFYQNVWSGVKRGAAAVAGASVLGAAGAAGYEAMTK